MSQPIEEKEAALYQFLQALVNRNEVSFFPEWIELWDRAHLPAKSKFIEMKSPYADPDQLCAWGNSENLAQFPLETWKENAIKMWLQSGHVFTPSQYWFALKATETADVLATLIHSGVDINAKHPRADEGGYLSNTFFTTMAPQIYERINESPNPDSVVLTIKKFLELGSDIETKSVDGKTPCEQFIETKLRKKIK